MLLYPEVRITLKSDQDIQIEAPWMQTSISNWQGTLEPGSLAQELWQFPEKHRLLARYNVRGISVGLGSDF